MREADNRGNESFWGNDPRPARPAAAMNRREFIYVGLVGGLGLTLGNYLGMTTANKAFGEQKFYESKEGVAKSVIHIFLPGGIAQHEFLDPKPYAPIEYRGPF